MLDVSMGILTEPFKFGKKLFGKIITFWIRLFYTLKYVPVYPKFSRLQEEVCILFDTVWGKTFTNISNFFKSDY